MATSEKTQTLSFEDCAFSPKRELLAGFLTDFLVEEKEGYVLNLNGSWGVGKTHFLKMWETELLKNYPVVYIDAWKTDFAEDPLLVVVNSILETLKKGSKLDRGKEQRIMKATYNILKPTGLAALRAAAAFGGVDGKVVDQTVTAIEGVIVDNSKTIFEDYRNQLTAIDDFHKEIVNWVDNYKSSNSIDKDKPIFVLVDELDRCRPSYAIELLEAVKHMFDLPNFIFVIATDTEQLQHSIRAVYGQGFDSPQYLTRFFDRSFELPEPNIYQYLEVKKAFQGVDQYQDLYIYPLAEQSDSQLRLLTSQMSQLYNLTLRDLDKLLAKIDACFRNMAKSSSTMRVNMLCLIHGIVLYQIDKAAFKRLPNKDGMKGEVFQNGGVRENWLGSLANGQDLNLIPLITRSFDILRDLGRLNDLKKKHSHNTDVLNLVAELKQEANRTEHFHKWIYDSVNSNLDMEVAHWSYLSDLIMMSSSLD